MFSGHRRPAPRHLAKASHPASGPAEEVVLVAGDAEVPAIARVHRSRLAFAAAITVAALPVLVLDNLPATAETNDDRIDVAADRSSSSAWEPFTIVTPEPTTASTPAPSSTAVAPKTTSTEAPSTTEDEGAVQAMQAPEPPPPTTAPPTTAAPAPPPPAYGDPDDPATWDRLAQCESNGNWAMNTGNGYYGGLQFSLATWRNVGGDGYPHEATRAEQIERGKILQARAGWDQWPTCAKRLGYY